MIYRFEGSLSDLYPIGTFDEGIRFHNEFSSTVVAGPFTGGRLFGVDFFLLRPDGVGVIIAPEVNGEPLPQINPAWLFPTVENGAVYQGGGMLPSAPRR